MLSMQRPIKFRAWVKTSEVSDKGVRPPFMGRVLALDILMGDVTIATSESITKEGDSYHSTTGSHAEFGLTDVEIMQFTGLTDRHAKEIYEGDILKSKAFRLTKGRISVVEYSPGEFIEVTPRGYKSSLAEKLSHGWIYEVIGNVYEDGELLK